VDGTVGDEHPVRVQDEQSLDEADPRSEDVLDDDDRDRVCRERAFHARPHLGGVAGVEHGRRLVEQQDAGCQREGTREGQPLRLTAGQRTGRRVQGQVQPDCVHGRTHGGRHVRTRHTHVLEPERDVPPDRGGDHPGARLLEDEADLAGARSRRMPVDEDATRQLTCVGGLEQAGHGPEQGRLAGPARTHEEHPLARVERQGDVAQDGFAPAVGAPRHALERDVATPDRLGRTRRTVRQCVSPGAPGRVGTR
jgi:hypothetical protein